MRSWILWLVLLAALWPVEIMALPQAVEDALPEAAEELLEEVGEDGQGSPDLLQGLTLLWNRGQSYLGELLRQGIGGAVMLLSVVLLCALAQEWNESGGGVSPVPMAGAIALTVIAAGDLNSLMGLGVETMEELNTFSKALLPTLMGAVAASGGAVSAGVRHVAAVFFADVLITLIRQVLLPLVYVYILAAAGDTMLPGRRLGAVAGAIRKGSTWVLSASLILYTGYLTVAGVGAGSADALAIQLTRSAMGAVPVVGGIISDAAGTVLSGAGIVRQTVGVVGILAILAICLAPFLRLAAQYLLYKITAFLAGTVGPPQLVGLIDALGGAFGLVLGMAGACATLLLISVMMAIMVVSR